MMISMRRLSRFAGAKKGLAALEFALLLPMMLLLLFGSCELIDVMMVNRRVQNVSSSLADVVARDTEVSNAEVQGLWSSLSVLMYPEGVGTAMDVRITSLSIANNKASVVWSEGYNGLSPLNKNSTVSLPSAMMQNGSSLIMAETVYRYNSVLGFLFSGTMRMTSTSYRRSRLVDPIPRVS
jgi:Flp pilus assembly protein TadG